MAGQEAERDLFFDILQRGVHLGFFQEKGVWSVREFHATSRWTCWAAGETVLKFNLGVLESHVNTPRHG
jgi:hypothetical protein